MSIACDCPSQDTPRTEGTYLEGSTKVWAAAYSPGSCCWGMCSVMTWHTCIHDLSLHIVSSMDMDAA